MNFTVASAPLAALRGRLHLQRWNSSPHTCRPSAACISAVEGVQRLCCHSRAYPDSRAADRNSCAA